MENIEAVRTFIRKHFQHVTDLGGGVLRGERIYADKPFALAYIDLSDSVVERSKNLTAFQEKLLGADFFSPSGDLRWNSYLYFLAGPKSKSSSEFSEAKSRIEGDRHFARKFVLDEESLARRLCEIPSATDLAPAEFKDIGGAWSELFRSASLSSLLEQRHRTTTLELIATGNAFRAEAASATPTLSIEKDELATGLLRKLTIGTFRRLHRNRTFDFGDVNLIVGANGTGKTSLLEAIEVLYCGRVRRDPDARFKGIIAQVEDENGVLRPVTATTNVGVLKARNLAWYRRSDFQASALSQGFTRFNFLDTDAAFRLSSDNSKEQIREDLGRLLVGAETSKLWNYLSKLTDEVGSRLKALDDRLPSDRKNVELLSAEVKRLREAPSEANTLLKAFRSNVRLLNSNWPVDDSTTLAPSERAKLELMTKFLSDIIASVVDAPITPEKLYQRLADLQGKVATAKGINGEYDTTAKLVSEAAGQAKEGLSRQSLVEHWIKIVEVGIPSRVAGLAESESRASRLRGLLRGLVGSVPLDTPMDYANLPIKEALIAVREKHAEAQEQEAAAKLALSQSVQLGQTLAALRRDLHDASLAYMQRSGEATLCPVCKTAHLSAELHAKIESLVESDTLQLADSLRANVNAAKERLEREQAAAAQLVKLDEFRQNSGLSDTQTTEQIQLRLRQANKDLRKATSDVQSHTAALNELSLTGIEWQGWGLVRSSVSVLLPAAVDPEDLSACKQALEDIKQRIRADGEMETTARGTLANLARQAVALVTEELPTPANDLAPSQVTALMERLLQQAESAAAKLASVAETIPLRHDQSLDELQRAVQACILSYDKALHAILNDAQSRSDLGLKEKDLQSATEALNTNTTARDYMARAAAVLVELVTNHSLESATADAFNAIKDKISDVFAQIHSPSEYELGDLGAGQFIVRRDNGQPHAVDQVSSGQRAALALSVFLALNDSAKTSPPVILIDDPVAHIDDLNALSFLDYLREMSLNSRKQVFFATADARLAAIFQRKFEFLGDKRFRKVVLKTMDS